MPVWIESTSRRLRIFFVNAIVLMAMLMLAWLCCVYLTWAIGMPTWYFEQKPVHSARIYAPGPSNRERLAAIAEAIADKNHFAHESAGENILAISLRRDGYTILDIDERGAAPDSGGRSVHSGWFNIACYPGGLGPQPCREIWPVLITELRKLEQVKILSEDVPQYIIIPTP